LEKKIIPDPRCTDPDIVQSPAILEDEDEAQMRRLKTQATKMACNAKGKKDGFRIKHWLVLENKHN
jgi:hypothetical protein